jgi:VanZ family protein
MPGHVQMRTGLPGVLEHVLAYCGTAVLFTTAYPAAGRARIMAALVCYAAVLEIGQLFVPDRSATLFDFGGSSLGVVLGCLLGTALARRSQPR